MHPHPGKHPLLYEVGGFLKEAFGDAPLIMSPDKWTDTQKERAGILFREFPDIKTAFSLTHSLRMIFSQRCTKEQGAESLRSWHTKVGEFGNKAFNDIAAAMYDREDEILNYFVNRSTNASAESLNAKIKQFRALLRGIILPIPTNENLCLIHTFLRVTPKNDICTNHLSNFTLILPLLHKFFLSLQGNLRQKNNGWIFESKQ